MISGPDRENATMLIDEAVESGCRLKEACKGLNISERTYWRWKAQTKATGSCEDRRPMSDHSVSNKEINDEIKAEIIEICNQPEYADLTPAEIVPMLADKGIYIASERTFYRVLKEAKMLAHRGRSKKPTEKRAPTTFKAEASNEVWTWDITYLKGPHKGMFYYLYMIVDIWDRFIVGYRVYECESAENASRLIIDTCAGQGRPLVLHSDNGSPMKGATMLATLYELGIRPSRSRPRVSNDNPYSESLFKTVKYRPNFQPNGFKSLEQAREWVDAFVEWYNNEHHHSGLKYLTPEQRRSGKGDMILAARDAVYKAAKAEHPERWKNRKTRDWTLEKAVYLNPAKASIESLLTGKQSQSA